MPPAPSFGGDRRLRIVVVATLAAVVVVLVVAGVTRVRGPGPLASAIEPTPSRGTTLAAAEQPCRGGQPGQRTSTTAPGLVTGGGLAFPTTDGWAQQEQVRVLPFGYDVGIETRWLSVTDLEFHAVARLSRADFPGGARAVAQLVEGCLASAGRFAGGGATEVSSGQYDVSGRYGWQVTAELRPADPAAPIMVVSIVVVDVGDPDWLAICVATSTQGDADADALRRAVTARLTYPD